jgi:CelD/BcsL family acetyltransferase involved in cellulose biosynthesis
VASRAAPLTPKAGRAPAAHAGVGASAIAAISWREMATDVAAWDRLALSAAEPNPYFESWFLLPALRGLDPGGKVSILRFEIGGKLCGLLPVRRNSRYYGRPLPHIAAWLHPNCFLGTPLVAKGSEAEFWRAFLHWADRKPGPALFLHLGDLALDGALFGALGDVLAETSRQSVIVQRFERALLMSQMEPAAYLSAALPKRKRHELQRQFNRLAALGDVRFEWQFGADGIVQWSEDFLLLEGSGWKGEAGSALACNPATANLLRESLAGAAARGRLARLSLLLNERPIAMLVNFISPPGAFGFKTAFDETYSRYSPGVLLEREYLKSLTMPDIEWSDSCAAPDHPVMDRLWRERRTIGKVSIAIGGPVRRRLFNGMVCLETSKRNKSE